MLLKLYLRGSLKYLCNKDFKRRAGITKKETVPFDTAPLYNGN